MALAAALTLSACTPAPAGLPTITASAVNPGDTASAVTATATRPPLAAVDPAALRGVEIQVWDAFAGGAYTVFSEQAAQFTAVNEWGITVNQTGFGDYSSLSEAVDAALASGSRPDLVTALPEQSLRWAASGSVVDLAPYMEAPGWGLETGVTADFPAIFLAQDSRDGERLGLPAQRSARFLFYNKTWAHELGFASPPVSAEDFREQACAANASFHADAVPQNDGYGGWIVDTHWQTAYSWMLAFEGGVVDGGKLCLSQ